MVRHAFAGLDLHKMILTLLFYYLYASVCFLIKPINYLNIYSISFNIHSFLYIASSAMSTLSVISILLIISHKALKTSGDIMAKGVKGRRAKKLEGLKGSRAKKAWRTGGPEG